MRCPRVDGMVRHLIRKLFTSGLVTVVRADLDRGGLKFRRNPEEGRQKTDRRPVNRRNSSTGTRHKPSGVGPDFGDYNFLVETSYFYCSLM